MKTPEHRLGFLEDADELKRHEFFSSINWDALKAKRYPAPISPDVKNAEDVSQFAEDFTKQDPIDKPGEPLTAPNAANFFKGLAYKIFVEFLNLIIVFLPGYSFVAPHLRKKKKTEELTISALPESSTRPSLASVLKHQRFVSSPNILLHVSILTLSQFPEQIEILQEVRNREVRVTNR